MPKINKLKTNDEKRSNEYDDKQKGSDNQRKQKLCRGYDDTLVRQIIECVVVESKEKIKVVFIGGTEIEMTL